MWFWIAFGAITVAALAIDLGVSHRRARIPAGLALIMTGGYIAVAIAFGGAILWLRGGEAATEYFTVFLLEKSLSFDNIFVFLVIFRSFDVPEESRHKVLVYGVLGAIVLRGAMIFAGAALLNRYSWVLYFFAAVIIVSGVRMLLPRDESSEPIGARLTRFLTKNLPLTHDFEGRKFLVRRGGQWLGTPLFAVVLAIEATDLVFAFDSIPAAFGVTRQPLLIYTANIFAVLGLRALYFAIADTVRRFRYLHYGLALVLILIGVKMVVDHIVPVPVWLMLATTVAVILGSLALSWLVSKDPGRRDGRKRK